MSDPIRPEPLTVENAALVLVDHQVGLMTGVRDYSAGELADDAKRRAKSRYALRDRGRTVSPHVIRNILETEASPTGFQPVRQM
jgi:hypothetical protein